MTALFVGFAVLDQRSLRSDGADCPISISSHWPPSAGPVFEQALPFATIATQLRRLPGTYSFVRTDEHGAQIYGSIIVFRSLEPEPGFHLRMFTLLSHSYVQSACALGPTREASVRRTSADCLRACAHHFD